MQESRHFHMSKLTVHALTSMSLETTAQYYGHMSAFQALSRCATKLCVSLDNVTMIGNKPISASVHLDPNKANPQKIGGTCCTCVQLTSHGIAEQVPLKFRNGGRKTGYSD